MPVSKLSDLLPIEASVSQPNAYEVFGLKGGEQDAAKVTAAMQCVYEGLKASKQTADPQVWKQAARLAEAARKLLEDPERRCALDVSLGVSAEASLHYGVPSYQSPGMQGGEDPLAGLLPSGDPVSQPEAEPATKTNSLSVLGIPPGTSGSTAALPESGTGQKSGTGQTSGTASVVVVGDKAAIDWAPPRAAAKRPKTNPGMLLFGLFVFLMLGAILGLLWFLTRGGRINVRPAGVEAPESVVVAPPRPLPDRKPLRSEKSKPKRDRVLGDVPSSGIAGPLRRPSKSLADANPLNQLIETAPPGIAVADSGPTMDSRRPDGPTAVPAPDRPLTGAKPMIQPSAEPSREMLEANQAKVDAVEQAICSGNWTEMKAAADALLKLPLGADQSKHAKALRDIADLASFYRGAIVRGLATLNAGGTFEYIDDFPVIVVEVSSKSLSIRYNGKIQTYSIDQLPPRLTEKIVSFALNPEQPDAIAAQALYRLIHSDTNDEYRADAFERLASVEGQLPGVDTGMLRQVANEILSK